jgi:hypothetical protein
VHTASVRHARADYGQACDTAPLAATLASYRAEAFNSRCEVLLVRADDG